MPPLERGAVMRAIAARLREHAGELALIDAANGGNPVAEMTSDVHAAAAQLDYFAGLAGEVKGETIPMGDGAVNMTLREPFGVCARIVAYNHPLMFTAAKMAAPLAAGNTVIMKPPRAGAVVGVPDDGNHRRRRAARRDQHRDRRRGDAAKRWSRTR